MAIIVLTRRRFSCGPERARDREIFGIAALHTQAGNHVPEEADGQGLLILTPSLRVVYRNHHARSLCNLINQLEHDKPANGIIPAEVFGLRHGKSSAEGVKKGSVRLIWSAITRPGREQKSARARH